MSNCGTYYFENKKQNIIADKIGVSPVYVEGEAEYLAEYGFLTENKEKCWAEFEMLKSPYVKAVLEKTPKHLY